MNLKHLSRLRLISTAAIGSLCVFSLAYLTFSKKESPTQEAPAAAEQSNASIQPAPREEPSYIIRAEDEEMLEPAAEPTSNIPNHQTDLDLSDAISAFSSAIAEDNTGFSTKELVHLDALFENLAHQQAKETSK